jgi:hypothetical protein
MWQRGKGKRVIMGIDVKPILAVKGGRIMMKGGKIMKGSIKRILAVLASVFWQCRF